MLLPSTALFLSVFMLVVRSEPLYFEGNFTTPFGSTAFPYTVNKCSPTGFSLLGLTSYVVYECESPNEMMASFYAANDDKCKSEPISTMTYNSNDADFNCANDATHDYVAVALLGFSCATETSFGTLFSAVNRCTTQGRVSAKAQCNNSGATLTIYGDTKCGQMVNVTVVGNDCTEFQTLAFSGSQVAVYGKLEECVLQGDEQRDNGAVLSNILLSLCFAVSLLFAVC